MKFFTLLASCIVTSFLVGCSSSSSNTTDFGGEDANKIASILGNIPDCSGNPKKIEKFITKGGNTAEISAKAVEVEIVGKPKIDGSSATCEVKVTAPGGSPLGQKTWNFVKEGSDWKIKDAPFK